MSDRYQRRLSSHMIGESWEISCHAHGMSRIENGPLKGLSLLEAINRDGEALLGTALYHQGYQKFPLLIKLLDAADVLSVQVHPDDRYAMTNENGELGKTEMWYVVEAKPGAKLVYGVKPGTRREDFKALIQEGRLEQCLDEVPVQAGDVLFIPAGMVHAIGEGILICEIQQNSDTTYRVYDWNRVDEQGTARELHIDKALDIIDFEGRYQEKKLQGLSCPAEGGRRTIYVACRYFAMEKLEVEGCMPLHMDGKRFQTLTCIDGAGTIEYAGGEVTWTAGQSCLIPASLSEIVLKGSCTVIRAYVPDKETNIIHPLLEAGYTMRELSVIAGLLE